MTNGNTVAVLLVGKCWDYFAIGFRADCAFHEHLEQCNRRLKCVSFGGPIRDDAVKDTETLPGAMPEDVG